MSTEFDKDLRELETKIEELKAFAAAKKMDMSAELTKLEAKAELQRKKVYGSLSAWHVVQLMRNHCSQRPDYIAEHTSIVDAVFRIFLVNDNEPLTARQLADRIEREPEIVLKTLAGKQVYQGLRPVHGV